MCAQRFRAHAAAGPRDRAVIAIPFDPDEAWGAKAEHPVGGTINGKQVRGTITPNGSGWVFTVTPMIYILKRVILYALSKSLCRRRKDA